MMASSLPAKHKHLSQLLVEIGPILDTFEDLVADYY